MPKKPYSSTGKETESLHEPELAYGLNADNIRLEMIRETLSIENVNVLHKALEYIRQLKQQSASKPPCQYTIEELRAHVMEAVEDIKAGRVYTNEEIIKMFPEWQL